MSLLLLGAVFAGTLTACDQGRRPDDEDRKVIVRWRAGAAEYVDPHGRSWRPDTEIAEGGTIRTTSEAVAGTGHPELYQAERVGVSAYRLPVPAAGTYLVTLYLAETSGARPGDRVFDVRVRDDGPAEDTAGGPAGEAAGHPAGAAEGRLVASGVDVAARSGQGHADHVVFTSTTLGGPITVRLVARAGQPGVAALTMSPMRLGDAPPVIRYEDHFDGPAGRLPPEWTALTGGGGWGNNELQTYTDRPVNASLDGRGHLVLRARQETFTGPDGITRHYTSARLTTLGRFDFTYGRVEVRARMPDGAGLLPAVWAMGTDEPTVGWPRSGEIDIVEAPPTTGLVHGTVHGPTADGGRWKIGGDQPAPADIATAFHTYSLDWYPGVLVFARDGEVYEVVTEADLAPGDDWVFDKPFYLLLSLAVGGEWPGTPPPQTRFPQEMVVDHIRVVA